MEQVGPWTGDHGGLVAPSSLRLFQAILAIRWVSLLVATAGYLINLQTHEMDYGVFLPALASATVYTVLITLFSRRVHYLHLRGPLFIVADFTVTFIVFSLTGTVWTPFILFGICSVMFAGLYARRYVGLAAGLALSALYVASLLVKDLGPAEMAAGGGGALAVVYMVEFVAVSVSWGYAVLLTRRARDAYGELADENAALEATHRALDERQRRLLALHRIRRTILLESEPGPIVDAASRGMREAGFARSRTWLLRGTKLHPFPDEPETPDVDVHSTSSLAVAVRDGRTIAEKGPVGEAEAASPASVVVPILVDRRLIGVVEVLGESGEDFDEDRIRLAELFVDQIALGLEHLRLSEQVRELAVVNERDRLTSEIHHAVVDRLETAVAEAEEVAAGDVDRLLREGLGLLRNTLLGIVDDLRASILDWTSLDWETTPRALVERYAREFSKLSGIPVEIEVRGSDVGLSGTRTRDVLRIVQEALSNVWRHADARSVRMALSFEPEGLSLTVSDDGRGFDTSELPDLAGPGLRTIEGRGRRSGGRVEISSTPGVGTLLRVWMPCG